MKTVTLDAEALREARDTLQRLKKYDLQGDVAISVRVNLRSVKEQVRIVEDAEADILDRYVRKDPAGEMIPVFTSHVDFDRFKGVFGEERDYEAGDQVWLETKLYSTTADVCGKRPEEGAPWVYLGELVIDGDGMGQAHLADKKEYDAKIAELRSQEHTIRIETVKRRAFRAERVSVPADAIWLEMIDM